MFDCSRGRCSKYFGDVYTPVHTVAAHSRLRSADHCDIVVPRSRSTRFRCHSFRVCGPTIWNKLPQDLWSTDTRGLFKRSLMSWLFGCVLQEACLIDIDWSHALQMDLLLDLDLGIFWRILQHCEMGHFSSLAPYLWNNYCIFMKIFP